MIFGDLQSKTSLISELFQAAIFQGFSDFLETPVARKLMAAYYLAKY